jgi:cytoskeletal protein CcmA (bactofilin family)
MSETELSKRSVSTNGKDDAALSVVAKGDSVQGHLVAKGDCHVFGKFRGEIDCAGETIVGAEADVAANVRTERITIAGFLRGTVTATGRLKIMATGRLEGDARVGSLMVQEGGVHHGVIRVHPEGLPAEDDTLLETSEEPVATVPAEPAPSPVGRVKKLWGELF